MRRSRSLVRFVLFVALLAVPTALTAQRDTLPSAELLKRLGEAVDGYRTGAEVYVVATRRPPYVVYGVYNTRGIADSVARSTDLPSKTYGPYLSSVDGTRAVAFIVDTCEHVRPSRIECPDLALSTAPEYVPVSDVDSVVVTILMRGGRSKRIRYGPQMDALFFSPSAIDKFVIPYYVNIVGVDSAAAIRRRIVRLR